LRFGLIVVGGVVSIAVVTSLLVPAVAELSEAASFESSSNIVRPDLIEGSTILDMNGAPMGKLVGAENRQVVPLEAVSDELIATVLAVEDADFYRHDGVSARSVLRALQANSAAGAVSQGGSTITQQLVKLSLVGDDRTVARKLKEASLALQLENQLCENTPKKVCKDRLLEQYLNVVYLGRGAYGVEAAAQAYYGIPASEVGLPEAAMLAALIRNPNGYDPIANPERAEERRNVVLRRMVDEGIIDEQQAELIRLVPVPNRVVNAPSSASAQDLTYFERKVRDELLDAEWLAPTRELRRYLIFNGGLTITSTMDPRAQLLAELAAESNPIAQSNPEAVAVVAAVEPATGAVRAVVGETTIEGRGVVEVATPAVGRSPGSSFKTFTLIAALEQGHTIRDTISAAPAPRSLYDDWDLSDRVTSWPSGCRGGSMTLQSATASSNNCAFARLQAAIGGDKVVDVARRLGITTVTDESASFPSLSLGGTSVRPLEMAAAYAAIANDGRYNPPHFVSKVEDRDGNVLFEYFPNAEPTIPVEVARQARVALESVVTGGTYRGGALPDRRPAAGKTGTNEAAGGENTDVWFVGFTPELSTAVWIGNPAGATELRGGRVQGGTTAARVWHSFMAPYLEPLPVREFPDAGRITSRVSYIQDPWRNASSSRSSSGSGSSGSTTRRSSSGGGGSTRSAGSSGGGSATTAPPATAPAPAPAPDPDPPAGEPDPGGD
jgi:penicillin-binding protein 1A